jgi:type IV pilus assembly protein PilC
MADYVWEARSRTGEVRKGVMEAENQAAVETRLRQQQLSPVRVRKKGASLGQFTLGSGVDSKELVVFTRQFATMIDAGLPLVQCLEILSNQQDNKIFQAALRDVKAFVEEGGTFSDALRRHPKIFDDLYSNLVQAGEVGGILDTILNRLAIYIEKNVKLQRQVKGALVYPTTVGVIAAGVMVVMMTFVIPTFENMFKDFGAKGELPKLTQYVINFSHIFISYLPVLVLGSIGAAFGFVQAYRNPRGKRFFHKLLLQIPVVGPVMRKIAVARFTRTLGTLLQSGVPILDALDIVAKTAGNVVVTDGIMFTRARISEGRTMAEPLAETKIFPGMVVQMIAVGEQTGALDQMLNKIADFYEDEVDVAVAALTSMLEPIMMVGIGGMVGVMLISMYLPIFSLAGAIKGD